MIDVFNVLGGRPKPVKVVVLGFILILAFSLISGFLVYFTKKSEINCEANFVLFNEDVAIPVLVSYVFNNTRGVAVLNGYIYKNGKNISHISRKIIFEYNRDRSDYLLTSLVVIKSSVDNTDNNELGKFIPGFYLASGSQFYFNIQRNNSSGWVFSTGNVPSFFCEKV